jgi:hypothetical protein
MYEQRYELITKTPCAVHGHIASQNPRYRYLGVELHVHFPILCSTYPEILKIRRTKSSRALCSRRSCAACAPAIHVSMHVMRGVTIQTNCLQTTATTPPAYFDMTRNRTPFSTRERSSPPDMSSSMTAMSEIVPKLETPIQIAFDHDRRYMCFCGPRYALLPLQSDICILTSN